MTEYYTEFRVRCEEYGDCITDAVTMEYVSDEEAIKEARKSARSMMREELYRGEKWIKVNIFTLDEEQNIDSNPYMAKVYRS